MDYQVYLIENPGGKQYIGLSENAAARLVQHNAGESTYTRGKGPWSLRWTSRRLSLSEARKLENKMKRQKGGAGLRTLLGIYGS